MMTYQTTITYPSHEDQMLPALYSGRQQIVQRMIIEGKTDGTVIYTTPVTGVRHWINEAAAQEYVDAVSILAAENGVNVVSVEIEPIA